MNKAQGEISASLQNLRKAYGPVAALGGVDLQVDSGIMYGLIGPDGAGKTTLLRILCGLVLPDAGEVRVLGFDPLREPEKIKAGIGYMPQRFSLYPDLTVAENLRFFADIYRVPKNERERLTQRLLEFSRLGPFARRKAKALSGGMKQKLALSCTLIHTPKLLILDEPTTGVDPVSRGEFWDILNDLRRQGVTVLVTTPYMDEAARCDRITLMYQGQALSQGSPEEIIGLFPHELIRVYTTRPQSAAAVLRASSSFKSVHVFGDRLHVIAAAASPAGAQIRTQLEKVHLPFSTIAAARPELEDLFVYLVEQRQQA